MVGVFKPFGIYLKFCGDDKPGSEITRSQRFPINGGTERKYEVVLVNND